MFAPKLNSILLRQFTDTLNIYPSPLYQVSNANWSAFLKGISDPPESRLEQWDPWRMPIGQWGLVSAPAGCVPAWSVIGHCVGVMAALEVSLGVFLPPPSPPTPPRPTQPRPAPPRPASHPTHHLYHQY